MSIDSLKIDPVQVLPSDPPEPTPQHAGTFTAGDPSPAPDYQVLLSNPGAHRHADFHRKSEEYSAIAGGIREKDAALQLLGQKIGALKAPLQAIVKQYPPYRPEDQERVRYLRLYAGLRKEMDALTVPRPAGDGTKSSPLPPPLPSNPADSQITDHLKDLDAASAVFAGMSQRLASDTASLARDSRLFTLDSAAKGATATLSAPDLAESAALQKSVQIGQQFASNSGQGVTTSQSHFLRSLG